MVRDLISFDDTRNRVAFSTVLAAALWPFLPSNSFPNPWAILFLVVPLVGAMATIERVTLFEAALPIPVREAMTARILSAVAMIWLPAIAIGVEVVIMRGWRDALLPLEVAAAFTLAMIVMQSFGATEAEPPRLASVLVFAAAASAFVPRQYWGLAICLSLAASAVLLARIWTRAPEGFVIAPRIASDATEPPAKRFVLLRGRRDLLSRLLNLDPAWEALMPVTLAVILAWPLCSAVFKQTDFGIFVVLCYAFGPSWQSACFTEFEAALPIAGRSLVTARLVSMLAGLWLPAVAMILETLLLRGWREAVPLVAVMPTLTLVLLSLQSWRISQWGAPRWTFWGLAVFLFANFWLEGYPHGGVVAIISVVACALLVIRLWFVTPKGFQIAHAKPSRIDWSKLRRLFETAPKEVSPTVSSTAANPPVTKSWRPLWWPAWRSITTGFTFMYAAFILPMAAAQITLGTGALFMIFAKGAGTRLEWLAMLPVSRRRMLLMLMVPWVCVVSAMSLWSTRYFATDSGHPAVWTGYGTFWQDAKSTGTGRPNVLVPSRYWRWASRTPVTIESPWGEQTQPATFLRMGAITYNPYTVAPHNSERFLAWQFARATEAVYGRSLPLVPAMLTARTQCIAALSAVLVLLLIAFLAFWGQAGDHQAWAWFLWFCFVALLLCDLFTAGEIRATGSLSQVLTLALAGVLPRNWIALAASALILFAGLYFAVERQFRKVDLTPALFDRELRQSKLRKES
jgi:hypothetical protein